MKYEGLFVDMVFGAVWMLLTTMAIRSWHSSTTAFIIRYSLFGVRYSTPLKKDTQRLNLAANCSDAAKKSTNRASGSVRSLVLRVRMRTPQPHSTKLVHPRGSTGIRCEKVQELELDMVFGNLPRLSEAWSILVQQCCHGTLGCRGGTGPGELTLPSTGFIPR